MWRILKSRCWRRRVDGDDADVVLSTGGGWWSSRWWAGCSDVTAGARDTNLLRVAAVATYQQMTRHLCPSSRRLQLRNGDDVHASAWQRMEFVGMMWLKVNYRVSLNRRGTVMRGCVNGAGIMRFVVHILSFCCGSSPQTRVYFATGDSLPDNNDNKIKLL